ncbi:pitrilysin family protein [Ferrovibrio terrae]|uniref:M16 family metallopeptidase n=1 Tax=Ferrovibrio terrae TaxID=2594003 RepID=UPI0031382E72
MRNRLIAVLSAAVLWLAGAPGDSRAQVFNPTQFMLGNGMQVVLIEDHRAPVVHHMVWYRVGAADEAPGVSGVAHYLEHLMFKGTPSVPPGEFSKIVSREGGRDNAFTSSDYTGYFQTIARDRLELVMRMEAERMSQLNPRAADAKPELQVVMEERLSRTDNNPGALFGEQLDAAQYLSHPYGRPVIGWPAEIQRLTLDDAMTFYRTHYAPNNAILIVAGDVRPAELKALAEKYYGMIPMRPVPPRFRPQEPNQLAARRLSMTDGRVTQPSMRRTYLAPSRSAGEKQHAVPLAVLAEILNAPTGRLHKALVRGDGPAVSAGAWYSSLSLDPGTFGFSASPKRGRKLEEVEAALDRVIADLLSDGIGDDEMRRARTGMQAETVFARDGLSGAARIFGVALTTGLTVEDVEAWPRLVDAVTRDQVLAAARYVFDLRRSVTGYLLPKEQS